MMTDYRVNFTILEKLYRGLDFWFICYIIIPVQFGFFLSFLLLV